MMISTTQKFSMERLPPHHFEVQHSVTKTGATTSPYARSHVPSCLSIFTGSQLLVRYKLAIYQEEVNGSFRVNAVNERPI